MTATRGGFDEVLKTLGDSERRQFKTGYYDGWEDKIIHWWQRQYYSKAYLQGYDLGRKDIDAAVQDAVEARDREGEFE